MAIEETGKAESAFLTTARYINSCQKEEQVRTAENMLRNFRTLYPTHKSKSLRLYLLLQLKRVEFAVVPGHSEE